MHTAGASKGDDSMGKNSRRRREGKTTDESSEGSTRAEARRQQRTGNGDGRSFLQRYRNVLIGVVAVVGVGLVGYSVFSSSTASAYTCESLLELPSSPSTARLDGELGFPIGARGATHSNRSIEYVNCPPTSGDHRGGGALTRDYYGPQSAQAPNDWIHNLEHGYAVIAYSGEPDSDTLRQIRESMDGAAPSEVALECGLPNKVIALRFDDMASPYAVLAWQRALLMDTFDPELVTTAATEFQDRPEAPERAC
jgi:hypothetical protein